MTIVNEKQKNTPPAPEDANRGNKGRASDLQNHPLKNEIIEKIKSGQIILQG